MLRYGTADGPSSGREMSGNGVRTAMATGDTGAEAARRHFGRLKYLYIGVDDFPATLRYHTEVLGARLVWHFHDFGTDVAAVELGEGPLLLLAEHRHAPSVLPIFIVDDLEATVADLRKNGWVPLAGPFGIPDGDCYTYQDPSGNEFAFFEDTRPDALVAAYAKTTNEHAVRP
jgi:predicted enzyme related to lactoylglutathione lyase